MSALDQAERLVRAGRRAEAVALVRQAAEAGDGESLYALANWHLYGVFVPRDPAAVHPLLERAAAAGRADAIRLRASLIASGTGCEADPERAAALLRAAFPGDPQLALLDGMSQPELTPEILSEDPPVRFVRSLFTAAECAHLISLATPALRPSVIIDDATGRPKPDPVRTSDGMNFGPGREDLVVNALNRRIAAATGTAYECGEPLHILRYVPGQEYKPHLDALPGAANQRRWTALVYLNDGYQGGETLFDRVGLSARGRAGDCLVFRNVDAGGRGDPRTRHAGAPVTGGTKWLATRWIRERPYDPLVDARGSR
ncbi:MAG TPA: 2OG-Fe(II) oxygenase [Allosphingosinicella sp.]|jgi:prolyl 4-hydroxylase